MNRREAVKEWNFNNRTGQSSPAGLTAGATSSGGRLCHYKEGCIALA